MPFPDTSARTYRGRVRARRRVVMRVVAVGIGLTGLALTVPTFAATGAKHGPPQQQPARKCCLVQLDGPARTVTAGGAPARIDLVVSRTDNGCTQTRRTITVRLGGLATHHVRVERVVAGQPLQLRDRSTEDGTVEAVDPLVDSKLICGADTAVAATYRIAFLEGAPPGRAELVVAAHSVNGKLLDSAKASTVVVEPVRTTPPPAETTPPSSPPVTDEPTQAPAAPPAVETSAPPVTTEPPPAAQGPAVERVADVNPLSTTLLTASIVFALSAMLLLGVLWRLRRGSGAVPAADEAPTASLPPGVGAELAMLTEGGGAAGPTRPAAP